ncbi:hypothetical protein JTB14_032168 [Gonioctena quinquepunctata]|nr:hypothetical protein JTB14_032168 [Gonioctena quinquepunctata]
MFQVPDELLDAMVCDSCHKFLSVGPVKVYLDKTTKCGRCSRHGDGGTISQYGLIAEQGLFKCVNRFDGCRQLVSYAEAADHESRCNSRRYMCPICPVTTEVPSFLLIKHFKSIHSDYFLDSPSFKVDVTVACTKTFLYRVRDNVFFIECKITSVDVIGLNIIFLGGREGAQNMKQRFTVHYVEDTTSIETATKTCDFFGSENTDDFLMARRESESNLVRVDFHLELDILEVYSLAGTYSSRKLKKIIGLPRNLSLDQKFQKSHPHFTVSSKLNSVILRISEKQILEYFTQCYDCKVKPLQDPYFFSDLGLDKYHYLCSICEKYYNSRERYLLPMVMALYYSCIWRPWGCSESHQNFKIENHEMSCSHQPARKCPVSQCNYTGKSLELLDHLRKYHREKPIMLPHIYNPKKTYVISTEKWYIWAYYNFVSMEISRRGFEHVMSIVPIAEEATGSPQPKVLIFDRSWNFLKSVTTDEPCHISIQNKVHIHAFFGE